ncbi:MAG: hypothetical protein HY554_04780 [Elusimicrobia bacterium]|nr:hypothetical protein [Elusimicrobiota bacterium]
MRRTWPWLLAVTLTAPLSSRLQAADPPAPPAAQIPAEFKVQTSGFSEKPGSDKPEPRCNLAGASAGQKLPYLSRGGVCKPQVWALLRLDEHWNARRGKLEADWNELTPEAQVKHLELLQAFFAELDGRFKAALDAGRAVLAGYQAVATAAEAGRIELAQAQGLVVAPAGGQAAAGPKVLDYHKAVRAVGQYLYDSGASLNLKPGGLLEAAEVRNIHRALFKADEELAEVLAALQGHVDAVLAACSGLKLAAAVAEGKVAAVAAKADALGQDLAQWNAAIAEGALEGGIAEAAGRQPGVSPEMAQAAGRSVTHVTARATASAKYLVANVKVPGAKGPGQVAAIELAPEDTLASAVEKLAKGVVGDAGWKAGFAALAVVAADAAAHPVAAVTRAVREAPKVQAVAPIAMSKEQYLERFKAEASAAAVAAERERRQRHEELERQYVRATAECRRLASLVSDPLKRFQTVAEGPDGQKKLCLARPADGTLAKIYDELVNDPKLRLPKEDIGSAFDRAFEEAGVAETRKNGLAKENARKAGEEVRKIEAQKRWVRQLYFRAELVKVLSHPKNFWISGVSSEEGRRLVLEEYADSRLGSGEAPGRKYYLAGWQVPADGKPDAVRHPVEDEFLAYVEPLVPSWGHDGWFWDTQPPDDKEVVPQVRPFIENDFRKWYASRLPEQMQPPLSATPSLAQRAARRAQAARKAQGQGAAAPAPAEKKP